MRIIKLLSVSVLAGTVALFTASADEAMLRGALERINVAACGDMQQVAEDTGQIDYRQRESSALVRKGVGDLDRYHTDPAMRLLAAGQYYRSIKADLDFALRHSPNHHRALQYLVQYDRGGGSPAGFPDTECYFYWAQLFAPDDPTVWQAGGYYYSTKNEYRVAEKWYLRALELDPNFADAHYNLGLLYIELGDYDRALEHAHAAYGAGHPLPGLRNRLSRLGQWRDPPAGRVDETALISASPAGAATN